MHHPQSEQEQVLFSERLRSTRTTALFALLSLLFAWLAAILYSDGRFSAFFVVCVLLVPVFLFYVINYRVLRISLTHSNLQLCFGLVRWRVPLENIAGAYIDQLPVVAYFGGAGVHFMLVRKTYRVSFNFLEYPRLTLRLRQARGAVSEVSFSTRQPEKMLAVLNRLSVPANSLDEGSTG